MKKTFLLILLIIGFYFSYAQHTIRIELKTDNYGSETTWELRERNSDTQITNGGPYADGSSIVQNIPDQDVDGTGCYEFIIYDRYSDGICCRYGNGYYKVYYDGELVGEGAQFGAEARIAGFGGGCPANEISLERIETEQYSLAGQSVEIKGVIKNLGVSLTSFDIRYKINDGTFSEYYTTTCDANMEDEVAFTHSTPYTFTESGLYSIIVEVANPNGLPDDVTTDDNTKTFSIIVNPTSVARRTVLEHFSTEQCPNCPAATTNITSWLSSRQDIIWVFHHVGYYTDQYTVASVSNPLLAFYNSTSSYAPAIMLDRKHFSPDDDPGPIFFPSASYTPGLLDKARSALSFVSINVGASYKTAIRELSVTVDGEFIGDVFEDNLRITVYLLEDGLRSTSQSGYTGTYTHNNVIRAALTPAEGDATAISGNTIGTTFDKTYTTTLNSAWNIDNLKIVAFVHNWGSDVNYRNILNAEQILFSDVDIVGTVSAEQAILEDVRIYPNPAKDMLNINNANNSDIVISNILGQEMVYINNARENQEINVSNFESGTYFVKIIKDGVISVHKILITK